jgi:hypothetical protein
VVEEAVDDLVVAVEDLVDHSLLLKDTISLTMNLT